MAFLKTNWPDILRWALTATLIAVLIWWLTIVNGNLNAPTSKDASGVIRDPYAHAKETLAVIIPFITLALGYWFGVKGADAAKDTAVKAQQQSATDRSKLEAVVAEAPTGTYDAVRKKYPGIFGEV